MNWFKDIIRAISKRKLIYLLLFVQLVVAIYNSYMAISRYQGVRLNNNKINSFIKLENTYGVRLDFPEGTSYTKRNDFNIVGEIQSKSKYKVATFKTLQGEPNEQPFIAVNSNLLNIYKLDVSTGKGSLEKEKDEAILGYNLKGKYKLGDKITCKVSGKDFQVIGFLKENQPLFMEGCSTLNDSIIILDDNVGQGITNGFVVSQDGYSKTKSNISKVLSSYGTIDFTNLQENLLDEKMMEYSEAKNMVMYSIGMLIFTLSIFMGFLILIIDKSKRDIGIKLACGAKKISIYGYLVGQLLFIYILASLCIFIVMYFILQGTHEQIHEVFGLDYFGIMNLVVLLMVVVVTVPIFIKIMKLDPAELVKGE